METKLPFGTLPIPPGQVVPEQQFQQYASGQIPVLPSWLAQAHPSIQQAYQQALAAVNQQAPVAPPTDAPNPSAKAVLGYDSAGSLEQKDVKATLTGTLAAVEKKGEGLASSGPAVALEAPLPSGPTMPSTQVHQVLESKPFTGPSTAKESGGGVKELGGGLGGSSGGTSAASSAASSTTGKTPENSHTQTNALSSGTSATPVLTQCPHCYWDLRLTEGISEPTYAQKLQFVHALLGQQCFTDEVALLNGQLLATFRTLTIREIDVVYRQAFLDKDNGRVVTELDFWEKVNRYRLYLQLRSLRSLDPQSRLYHDLPDGLSPDTNLHAKRHWATAIAPAGDTPLVKLEEQMMQEILPTETLFRIVHAANNRFNRLAARLEAMIDHSDFWKPTE